MVPVQLSLSNFLSYGEKEQTLDFSRFHVACLSGKNGQGKSALLDAITWVLWGEARKSSGGHKPDEELLRIGTRRMRVELVFEAEKQHYRVIRAYTRSATGKTSKAELELQLLDWASGDGRPLTRASIRETQTFLDELLGLDYQTFINSAFLLQGRSDEFTKKKPGERKQILGKILNLEKYDRLALMARDKQRKVADELAARIRDIERLTGAIESESEWKKLEAEVISSLAHEQTQLKATRGNETLLMEQLGGLEVLSREAELHQETLKKIASEKQRLDEEKEHLMQRVANAEGLIKNKDQIQKNFEYYNVLVKEREDLDGKRDLYRGFEMQVGKRESELQRHRFEQEQQKRELQGKLRNSKDALRAFESSIEAKTAVEEQLMYARKAASRMQHIQAELEKRDQLIAQKTTIEKAISEERNALIGELKAKEQQHLHRKKEQPDFNGLARLCNDLEALSQKKKELISKKEDTKQKGQALSEEISQIEGEIHTKKEVLEKAMQQHRHFRETTASACPTCGSELTAHHREEVIQQLEKEINELQGLLAKVENENTQRDIARKKLREEYVLLQAEEQALGEPEQKLAQVTEQLRTAEVEQKNLESLEKDISQLQVSLEKEAYADAQQVALKEIIAALDTITLDDEGIQKDKYEAHQVERYEERLKVIIMDESRREKLYAESTQLELQLKALLENFEESPQAISLRNDIEGLKEKMKATGFNSERLEQVKRTLRELTEAPNQMKDLLNAQQNISEWETQQTLLSKRLEAVLAEKADVLEKAAIIGVQLEKQNELETQLGAVRTEKDMIEERLRSLQIQQGELSVRLEQVKKDKAALKEARKLQKTARSEEGLYSKLRKAFGRDGIPSLIIEQTLPEIEDRANELLLRLTEGKMNVRLETLRDKKTGGTKETLEIIITDEQGAPRPYETFSGGEAFRVNFALRIALSQLLAERNGVKIRTLGIDEGFGTQDEQGIQNMIEAIQVIQDDFDKILVITHLDRLKEAFPVRIEVEKDAVIGSQFTVIEG